MRRRTLLGAVGAGLAGLGGCAGILDDAPAGTPSTPRNSRTASPGPETSAGLEGTPVGTSEPARSPRERTTATPDPGRLRLRAVDAPERVPLGEPARYRFTLENAADEPRVVEPETQTRTGPTAWSRHQRWNAVELPAGARHTFESVAFTRDYLGPVEVRVAGFDPAIEIEFVEPTLRYTQGYDDPLGREVRVDDLAIRSTYTYERDGVRRVVELEAGRQFVFLTVEVVNRTDGPLRTPPREAFRLLEGRRVHFPIETEGDAWYGSTELPWGARTEARIAFETAGSIGADDLRAAWRESFDGGDVGVVWSTA